LLLPFFVTVLLILMVVCVAMASFILLVRIAQSTVSIPTGGVGAGVGSVIVTLLPVVGVDEIHLISGRGKYNNVV
jgi:hypothetical protein